MHGQPHTCTGLSLPRAAQHPHHLREGIAIPPVHPPQPPAPMPGADPAPGTQDSLPSPPLQLLGLQEMSPGSLTYTGRGGQAELCTPGWHLQVQQGAGHLRGHLGASPGSGPRPWHPSAGPHAWRAQKDCRICWLAWLALPCLSSPGWAVLFNSLQGQHSTKEGLWRACSSAGQCHDWLWRVKVERAHGRAAAASLTNALYSLHNVHPATCAVPAPPGISIDWFPRTHLQKFPCTFDLGEGWLEISRAGQCQFFIQLVIFFV